MARVTKKMPVFCGGTPLVCSDEEPPFSSDDAARQAEARRIFPNGLYQPESSFRCSVDAPLLAEFAADLKLPPHAAVADLGTGCGVAGLALLLRRPGWRVVGLERDPALVEAARINAARLGLPGFTSLAGDVADSAALLRARRQLGENTQFDAVVCNPPWRLEGTGRVPLSPPRRAALFGDAHTLGMFFQAAESLLKKHGVLAVVCGAARLGDALQSLPERLRPVRLRFVHHRPDRAATLFLLEARKNSRAALSVDAPLFLSK